MQVWCSAARTERQSGTLALTRKEKVGAVGAAHGVPRCFSQLRFSWLVGQKRVWAFTYRTASSFNHSPSMSKLRFALGVRKSGTFFLVKADEHSKWTFVFDFAFHLQRALKVFPN